MAELFEHRNPYDWGWVLISTIGWLAEKLYWRGR